jgi:ATP-dependent helicase/nuclease subunit A
MELIEERDDLEPELFRRFHAALLRDEALRADHAAVVYARGRKLVRRWLGAALDKRVEVELADAAGVLESSVPGAGDEFAGLEYPAQVLDGTAWRGALHDLAAALGRGGAKAQQRAATVLADALGQGDAQARFEAIQGALFTREGAPRKHLGAVAGLAEVQAELEGVAQAVRAHEARNEHLRMLRLARVLLVEYAALKRARGLADMADLERCALELLRDSQLAAWLQERLDTRLRHVLIDEFQDTSPLQWHALHAWLAGYAGAGGGASGQQPPTLFIVGDPKQSIYRFRGAEPRVFDAAREFVREALGGAALSCDQTRRNRPGVLAAVNAVFEAACAEGAFDGFRAHSSTLPDAGGASVFTLPRVERATAAAREPGRGWRDSLMTPRREPEDALRRREADLVAQAIRETIERDAIAPGEIMVLSRRRAPLRWLARRLSALHLPYVAVEDGALLDSPEARDLLALLDVLASPRHDLSLAQALKSPLFGAGDADLVALAQAARERGGSGFGALQAQAPTALSPAMQRARALLADWRDAAARLPPHDLLDRIVAEGELHARVAAAVPAERVHAALADIDALLGQALALDGGRYATPYGFVRALRRRALKIAARADAQAVRLLTVHGAKGLEARAVFLMDADPESQKDESASVLVDWPVTAPLPRRCAFIASAARPPPGLLDAMALEQAARRREELNGLYVAMTRAGERLVFSCTEPYGAGEGASWWQRIAAQATPWQPTAAERAVDPAPHEVALATLPPWQPPRAEPAAAPAADSAASRLGQALHRVLEWSSAGAAKFELDVAARQAAREFALAPGAARELTRRAGAILASPECAPFFAADGLRWAGNEVTIATGGAVGRIDRLVQLDDGGWWVLDYKLERDPAREPRNLQQLRGYRAAVAALQPGAAVRAAFIDGTGELIEIE